MVEAGQRKDGDALLGLYLLLEQDVKHVLCAVLRNRNNVDDAMQDVRVRIFIYLPRFSLPIGASEAECQELLRRWATNVARNWARLINAYGLDEVQNRYVVPQWAVRGNTPFRRRQAIVHTQSTERDFVELEGESSEYTLERLAHAALESGRMVSA
jgi:DNA-directed RNA polymerase specialized sigma24 family protein